MLRTAALLALLAAPALADGGPVVRDARLYLSFALAKTASATMVIENPDGPATRLLGAATPAASMVMLHGTETGEDGVARMAGVDGVDLPEGGTVTLAPGGLHLMLMGLTAPLEEGDVVPLTLDFATGPVTVELPVDVQGVEPDPAG